MRLHSDDHRSHGERSAPLVSIVIPAKDLERFIEPCLRSLQRQTFHDWEALVLVNASTDRTVEKVRSVAEEDPRILLVESRAKGVSAVRNQGFKLSRGRFLMFLDGDDWLAPETLASFLDSVAAHPEAGLHVGNYRLVDEDGTQWTSSTPMLPRELTLADLVTLNPIANGGQLLTERSLVERAGGFPPVHWEDWVLWCRIAALKPVAIVETGALLYFRQRQHSTFRTLASELSNFEPAIKTIFDDPLVKAALQGHDIEALRRRSTAECLWLVGRERFRLGKRAEARSAMLRSLGSHASLKRAFQVAVVAFAPGLAPRLSPSLRPYDFMGGHGAHQAFSSRRVS